MATGFNGGGGPMARAAEEGGGGALGVDSTLLRCRSSVPGVDGFDCAVRRGGVIVLKERKVR